jgi:dCMP deaminase
MKRTFESPMERVLPKPKLVEWDELFMSMVFLIASKSKDERTHIGAVIVDENNIVRSLGYNGFPRGLDDNIPERQEKPEKYFWMVHSEQNAIYNAKTDLSKCRMYTNGMPCADCAKAIIQSGITQVITYKKWNMSDDKWEESCKIARRMFEEVGVTLRQYNGDILRIQGWKDGKIYTI